MEKIEGQNLEQWLNDNDKINEEQALDWLKQITIILNQLHSNNFFHRDIKPANIMRREEDGKLFLIDLGSVKLVSDKILKGEAATTVGTYGYMAPEQINGNPVIRSDFYALGRTFVHLLTNIRPNKLPKDSNDCLIWREKALPISDEFDRFIDSLMDKEVGKRPQTTAVIFKRIEELQKQLERRKNKKNNSNFRPILFAIFFLVVLAGYLMYERRNLNNPTTTNSPTCRIRKNGEKDVNALAKDAQEGINKAKQEDIFFGTIREFKNVIYPPEQNNCKIIVRIEANEIDPELKFQLESVINLSINPKARDFVTIDIVPNVIR
jgi:serine/threonine protein kinase